MKSVIILSGGMDSAVLALNVKKNNPKEKLYALTFDYGSVHNEMEITYAKRFCKKYRIPQKIVKLPLGDLFNSALLKNAKAIPNGYYKSQNMKKTVVPFRNGIMLSIAAGYAASMKARRIYIGSHAGDHYIYPDCRPQFNYFMWAAIRKGTDKYIYLNTPFEKKTKREIGLIGKELGLNFALTYTCYKGGKLHCGVCGSCTERKEALQGFDPTRYQK